MASGLTECLSGRGDPSSPDLTGAIVEAIKVGGRPRPAGRRLARAIGEARPGRPEHRKLGKGGLEEQELISSHKRQYAEGV